MLLGNAGWLTSHCSCEKMFTLVKRVKTT
jgi:hypothetical protein